MLDEQRIPYNNFRSPTHYMKYFAQNQNVKIHDLSFNAGYNSFLLLNDRFNHITNVIPRMFYDTAHGHTNNANQLDNGVRAKYLTVL